MRLWVDVPVGERVTWEFLKTRRGWDTPGWAKRTMEGRGCVAGVQFLQNPDAPWHPCKHVPLAGQKFCWVHGGKKRRSKAVGRLRKAWRVLWTGKVQT